MPFDYGEFLTLAKEMIEGERRDEPAHIRTACGRAYYAVYGLLRSKLIALDDLFAGRSYHRQLHQACAETNDKTIRKLAKPLETLFDIRSDADYEPEADIRMEDAEAAIDTAEDLKERIRNLSFDNVRALHHELNRHIAHLEEGTRRPRP
jgi:uncharacterized protein (UPF0332 family)